ncbi:MAG: V-type ATPase subunit [Rhodobacteraceae bacterium]|nr:V-type ATPase subunit [Paracoccaceae bacterium]
MTQYFDLSDDQFEKIVIAIGQRLFGAGLMGFAPGKDGGRDAKFKGTAEYYPSAAEPWTGCTIIQAKHTNGINASFSDPAVCNVEKLTGLICEEIPKIKALYESGEAQNYLLISNRKLSGIAEPKLTKLISDLTGMPIENIALAGTQQLDDWLELFPDAKASLSINPLQSPLIVSPDDLADTIEGFREAVQVVTVDEDRSTPTPRTSLEEKNRLNNMTPDFETALRKRYFELMFDIRKFLSDPINERFKASYQEAVDEFNLKIIAKRTDYETFDDVFNYLLDLLIGRSGILRSNRRLTRAMLYYMYWNCDIGRGKDDQTV